MADDTGELTPEQLREIRVEQELLNEARRHRTKQFREGKLTLDQYKLALEDIAQLEEELTERTEKHTKATQEGTKATEEARAAHEKQVETFKTVITGLTGITDSYRETTFSVHDLGQALRETFDPLNVAGSFLKGVKEQTVALTYATDQALVSFAKNTGMQAEFGESIKANESLLRSNGVMIQEVADATNDLAIGFREFTELSGPTRDSMVQMVATLDKMGVSSATQVKSMDILSTAMGRSGMAAAQFQADVYALGVEVGIGGPQAVEAFAAAAPKLAKFGSDAGGVFADLAKAAKDARMEISELIGIAEQFDTFAGAAEAVGQLNALLGGPFLNSMEMVMATNPAERIGMISEALSTAGKDFETMTYYERQAIANAAGLSDVGELAKIMAGDFDNLTGSLDENAMTQEELNKLTTDFNTIAEEVKQTLMLLAVQMEPLLSWFKGFLQMIQDLGPVSEYVILGLGLLASAVLLLKVTFAAAAPVVATFSAASSVLGATAPPAASATAASLVALTKAIGPFAAALATAAPAVLSFGTALATITVPLAVIAAAGAVALFGFVEMMKVMGEIGSGELLALGGALLVVAAGMYGLAAAVGVMGLSIYALPGFLIQIFALTMSLSALSFVVVPLAEAMTNMFDAFSKVTGGAFTEAAAGLTQLVEALEKVPEKKTIVVTEAFEAGAAYEASMAIREATAAAAAGGAAGGAARPAGPNQPIVLNLTAGVDKRTLFTVFEEFNLDIFGSSDPSR